MRTVNREHGKNSTFDFPVKYSERNQWIFQGLAIV